MIWWTWGLIAWSLLASAVVVWLAALCTLRGRRTEDDPSAVDTGSRVEREPEVAEASSSGHRSTQPLDHLRPALAAAAVRVDEDQRSRALERLLQGARAGYYTLPPPLLRATEGHRRLRGLSVRAPRAFARADAAASLVSEATRGGSLDPLALSARVHRSRSDMLVFTEALELMAMAVEFGEHEAGAVAGELSRRIIEHHLRPAHRQVLADARRVAVRLGPYTTEQFDVEARRIVTANRRARSAYAALPILVRRYRSIRAARDAVNLLGEQRPQHDVRDVFAFFQDPLVFAPPGLPYSRTPEPPLPEDDTARLLWLVSDRAGIGRPWLPTVSEQDAAWLSCFEAPAGGRRTDRVQLDENRTSARGPRPPRPRPASTGMPGRAEDVFRVGRNR